MKRLDGSPDIEKWVKNPVVMALTGVPFEPDCRILFAREIFDYHPELEDHELISNHLGEKAIKRS